MPDHATDAEFDDFVRVWWPGLYRTAFLLVGDLGLAEDLVQTSLAKTYVAWPRLRDQAAAPAYARKTLVNTAASWFRRKSWRREIPSERLPEEGYEPSCHDRVGIETALRQLPPRQRAVVVLRYFEDLSVAETASTLGCRPGTVKNQTFVALRRLRVLLGDSTIPSTIGEPT